MNSSANQSPPFQFGIRALLAMTAVVAVVCSLLSWIGWSWKLAAFFFPLVCFVAYQLFYALITRWITRGSWDGANHTVTAVLAIVPIVAILLLLLFLLP